MLGRKIEKFVKVKEKIRQAIISKGVDVAETATLAEMASKIQEIKVIKIKKKEEKNDK